MRLSEQVCKGTSGKMYRQFLKMSHRRRERRRAKLQPEAMPTYGKYRGYET